MSVTAPTGLDGEELEETIRTLVLPGVVRTEGLNVFPSIIVWDTGMVFKTCSGTPELDTNITFPTPAGNAADKRACD